MLSGLLAPKKMLYHMRSAKIGVEVISKHRRRGKNGTIPRIYGQGSFSNRGR